MLQNHLYGEGGGCDASGASFTCEAEAAFADTAYGTGHFLGWLVGRGIAPHIPVRDASERDDGTFSRSDFRWDRRHGVYICPNNKVLHTTGPCTMATCSATAPPNSTAMLLQEAMLSEYGCPTGTP